MQHVEKTLNNKKGTEDVENYIKISETKSDKEKLKEIGKQLITEMEGG